MRATIDGWRPSRRWFGMNSRCHWAVTRRAKNEAKRLTLAALGPRGAFAVASPWRVTLQMRTGTRGGRLPDGDNLQSMLKAVRDAVAAWIGVDDGDARYEWVYPPVARAASDAVEITIETSGI